MANGRAVDFCRRVLNFWFPKGRWASFESPPARTAPIEQADVFRWFKSSPEFDQSIREDFESDLTSLVNDEYRYPDDLNHPEHLLACVIAFDQFPRNIYRGDARAFAYDHKARELSELLMRQQADKQLPYFERTFVYLPFEHSENLDDQDKAVSAYRALYDEASNDPELDPGARDFLRSTVTFAEQHHELIRRFGRFPHRNTVLNRQPTDSEEIYLRDGGERFGQ